MVGVTQKSAMQLYIFYHTSMSAMISVSIAMARLHNKDLHRLNEEKPRYMVLFMINNRVG